MRPSAAEAIARSPTARVVLNNRYELGQVVGAGGMASVHVARDLLLGRDVAVKLFRREAVASPDVRLQEIEARVVATLNHPALTTLLDAGVEAIDGGPPQIYLVMEYVRGVDLRKRLRLGPMEVADVCWLGFDLAEGLAHMHQAGFIHRDVKPANILISNVRSARPVVAKLTDFGIASPIGARDLSEYTVGTAAYLSPEQVEGHDARPESDTYSLGVVLLEAMTGRVAFPGSVEESAFARLDHDPPVPDSIPEAVADLLRRMTARHPESRVDLFSCAVELQQFLVDDLVRQRAVLAPEAPAQQPPPRTGIPPLRGLGSAPDVTADVLVRLVAQSIGVPKALLITQDENRPVAKAQHGWDSPVILTGDNGPPSLSRATIASANLRQDPASGRMPVADATVRAHASALLTTHDGRVIGELFVFDDAERPFTDSDLATLSDVADLLVHDFELRAAARRALIGGDDAV